jgi:hypothetical protein
MTAKRNYVKVTMRWENGEHHEYVGDLLIMGSSLALRKPRAKKFVLLGRKEDCLSIEEAK